MSLDTYKYRHTTGLLREQGRNTHWGKDLWEDLNSCVGITSGKIRVSWECTIRRKRCWTEAKIFTHLFNLLLPAWFFNSCIPNKSLTLPVVVTRLVGMLTFQSFFLIYCFMNSFNIPNLLNQIPK